MNASTHALLSGVSTLDEVGDAWSIVAHGRRHDAVLAGAHALRKRIEAMPMVMGVRTLPITTLPYPTRYAFQGAAASPAPYVMMAHRALLVQFRQGDALRTLLFNPTDVERARRTPFFASLEARVGTSISRWLSTQFDSIESQLEQLGLSTDDIDYVAYDHFHTQDLRSTLGTSDGSIAARFANATLLAPRAEWEAWHHLHPMQRAWYVADGRDGVREERVALIEEDLCLGDGVMLVRTPGHTEGNQTLFFKTSRGVWGVSENGTCVDNWAPQASRVGGVAAVARTQALEVMLNANTPEGAAMQYSAMCLEKIVVDRLRPAPDFVQMFPSSEIIPAVFAPGLTPSYLLQKIEHGEIQSKKNGKIDAVSGFGAPPRSPNASK